MSRFIYTIYTTTVAYLNIVGISFPPNNSVLQSDCFLLLFRSAMIS